MPSEANPNTDVVVPELDERARARASITSIFGILKIAKVVYVDDIFEAAGSQLNSFIGSLETVLPEHLARVAELLPGIALNADVEVWDPQIREWWDDASLEIRDEVIGKVSRLAGDRSAALDYRACRALKDILPEGVPVIEVAPSEWSQGQLAGATADARVLCLIDREFTYSDGLLPAGIANGVDLLAAAVTEPANDEVVFGLFSHTFSSGEELDQWRMIAAEKALETDQFLPFSKGRQNNILEFAVQLEMVTFNMFCDRLKRAATISMARAHKAAAEQLRELNVYEFEKMVLEASREEGMWEPDALFRIFQIFHRDAARADISRPEVARQVNGNVLLAREVSKCRIREPDTGAEQRWNLRHRELYEDGTSLNSFHAPLRAGDIFIGNRGRTYILLAQPCDLAVRTDTGARKNRHVSLVCVENIKKAKLEQERQKALAKGYDFLETRGVLSYFTPGKDDVGLVRYAEHYPISADLLDLAVLNPDGGCRIDVKHDLPLPPQLSAGWRQRAEELRGTFRATAEALDHQKGALAAIDDPDRTAIWHLLMPKFGPTEFKLPEAPYSEGVFAFDIRRAGHFRDPGATRLLAAYTRYLSRDAEDYDFGQ